MILPLTFSITDLSRDDAWILMKIAVFVIRRHENHSLHFDTRMKLYPFMESKRKETDPPLYIDDSICLQPL